MVEPTLSRDDEYAPAPDFVVLDYIACSVHSDPDFKRRARDAWQQVAEERDAAASGYAALAAGLDTVVAGYERQLGDALATAGDYDDDAWRWRERAEAAEAQLAAAREAGARSMAAWLATHTDCDGEHDLALCATHIRVWTQNRLPEQDARLADTDAVLAAWRAAQGTEAKR